jgi:inorganic triphosphatase YgiF
MRALSVSNFEIEAKLAVCTESPESIADEIGELDRIGPYFLKPLRDLAIRDVYLDLADHWLREHGLGLRVRDVDGHPLVTLKGKAAHIAGGGIRREEIELPWSDDAMELLAKRIEQQGLLLRPFPPGAVARDPLDVLSQLGFVVEQQRDTRRRPRDVTSCADSTSVLAELAVDSVVFHFGSQEVRHHEVEIEVKEGGNVDVIQDISNALLARWPNALRTWRFGKRSTGRAVESLLTARGRAGLVTASGNLSPGAYDLIAAYLG